MVEGSTAGAADLIEHTVEDTASLLVLVESLIQKVPEIAAALRDAPAERVLQRRHRVLSRRVVLHERDEIARAGEADADDFRIGGAIDDVVDAADLEAAVERDHPGLAAVHEPPLRSRDDAALRGRIVANRHHALRALRINRRVSQ